jgi:aminoglycoside phosphotransferase (APT) family kinase protein
MRYALRTGFGCWHDVQIFTEAAMPDQPELRRCQLMETLHQEYGELGITDFQYIGEGMDAKVYRAHSPELGPVAIKMPHDRWISSGNEPRLDTRVILRKEFRLSRHLQAHGLQAPEAFFMHTDDEGVDFIVSQFVESDNSELLDSEFGHLIRAIHDLPAPSIELSASEPSADADEILTERIERRLKMLASIVGVAIPTPDIGSALSAWRGDDVPGCLLHMDLRPENILVRNGHPVAILDWSNALVGEAALDLSRAAEYGSLSAAALAAYGKSEAFSMTPRTPREIIYRLDTAVMLAHVFLQGAPDEVKAQHYIQRTESLCRSLLEISL